MNIGEDEDSPVYEVVPMPAEDAPVEEPAAPIQEPEPVPA